MPEADGRLTPEERQKIANHLQKQGGGRPFPCAFCGKQEWIIGNHFVQDFVQATEDGFHSVPCYALFCATCGFCVRFNATLVDAIISGQVSKDLANATPANAPSTSEVRSNV